MKKQTFAGIMLCAVGGFSAQTVSADSVKSQHIPEVIVIGTTKIAAKQKKPLGSIDEYLEKSAKVNMIRRGAYAWEPVINGMQTERTVVTIDGMRIFGACTDKMDPVTSYIEVSNLREASISSGQEGSFHGNTIGGSIDLKRNRIPFGEKQWKHYINSGFESVNIQKIFGGGTSYKSQNFYTDINFMTRDAENYKAGDHEEIPFSQFSKINLSGLSGIKLGENKVLEASVIYDKATDVGYPALPMDVSVAEALITSLTFRIAPKERRVKYWETKAYFNTIMHKMDDTKRPSVPIHMDMPGWSKTYGYYSNLKTQADSHEFLISLNGFYNKSSAEMTMYPKDKNEKLMFMLTWPDVRTFAQAVYLQDEWKISDVSSMKMAASVTLHSSKVESEFGLNSLQIFYPEMNAERNRIVKSLAVNYEFNKDAFRAGIGIGYGDRAPSVSEGNGFYLFNSSEKYDYIGNPFLKNESSVEGSAFISYKKNSYSMKASAAYFHISDYIVGEIIQGLLPMTIGARGVKNYTSLKNAGIVNASLETEIQIAKPLKWNSQLVYMSGRDYQGANLPFISPFSYRTWLSYQPGHFSADLTVSGNAAHRKFAEKYGESLTAGYTLVDASVGWHFIWGPTALHTKFGVENFFDRNYISYADWNSIPRPGRNVFINLNFGF